ncbi:MAG: 50S ribosomal protein L22 [Candidatus Wildermuthbacteria bacterium GWA2_46_15]|uniref:Large ribosomal subunit protein uL22 n=1 Tax=Candidatus Wildermuthbacteria bacterium GWA2_46_15 TaxID=1802443 RepID=A0A1G2QNW5_9BACT|nr:MAG: 50S ribosomal protein L22 [Candidatus Wildermuthbacteria bacterium GWA2_46_15]
MEVVAKLNHLRMAPRKVRLVADVIRGKNALKARANLSFLPRRAAKPFLGLLDSALANAKNNFQLDEKTLYLAKVLVDEGPKLKRWRPRARGRAFPIQKKTSHLTIVLQEREGLSKKRSAAGKRTEKTEVVSLVEKAKPKAMPKTEKQKIKPELATPKPKLTPGFKKIFRRKAI